MFLRGCRIDMYLKQVKPGFINYQPPPSSLGAEVRKKGEELN